MLHYGGRTHDNRVVFYGFEGVIMGSIMGSQNIMGSDYGSNISVDRHFLDMLVTISPQYLNAYRIL